MANAGKGFLGLLDMIDGGGMGQSGSKFEGGPISGFLNALGVRPHGYMDRLSAVRPEMRPAGLGAAAPMRPVSRSDGYSLEPFGGAGPDVMSGYGSGVMPAEIGNDASGMDIERRGPGRSPTGPFEINPQIFNAMLLSLPPEGYMAFQRYTPEQKRRAYLDYVQSRGMGFGPR